MLKQIKKKILVKHTENLFANKQFCVGDGRSANDIWDLDKPNMEFLDNERRKRDIRPCILCIWILYIPKYLIMLDAAIFLLNDDHRTAV